MLRKRLLPWYLMTIATLLLNLVMPKPAAAAGTVGDGTPGSCTEAALDTALIGGGLVSFNCGPDPVTITFTGEKTILEDTTIDGGNLIILSGGNTIRPFTVEFSNTLNLKNLTLTNGNASPGGAIYNNGIVNITNVSLTDNLSPLGNAGGIYNYGALTITNSVLSNNIASAGLAGAIDNMGTMTIENSTLGSNFSGMMGGGLINSGTATIISSTFTTNQALIAGAIYNHGLMTIIKSDFIDNTTTSGGGAGIFNDNNLSLYTSTFSGNTTSAGSKGGGLYNMVGALALVSRSSFINNGAPGGFGGGIANEGLINIVADVFSGNYSSAGLGGGVYSSTTHPTVITNSTFSSNFGGLAGGGLYISGTAIILNSTFYNNSPDGLANNDTGEVNIKNIILASNSPVNCQGTTVSSQGYNLEDGVTCALSGPGDQSNTNPLLGPLADNGGPTLTHALLYGSPAINAVSNNSCPLTDQRGVKRPLFGTCDIGAYEYGFLIRLPLIGK